MKKIIAYILLLTVLISLSGCQNHKETTDIVATTKPVYDFTSFLCLNTNIRVTQLVTENLSCLHDYTLQVRQMREIEEARSVILSGAGLESFLEEPLKNAKHIIDASQGIQLHCGDQAHHDEHSADGHHHEQDPHIWLNISNSRSMAENIYNGLLQLYPEHKEVLTGNFTALNKKFDELDAYGKSALSNLASRKMITFHDGFSYFADYWDLQIIHSLEEESGSEASAAELKELIGIVQEHNIPAIFTEENGSTSASAIVARETGIQVFALSMGMSEKDYFETMYHNIDTIKEALG